MSKKTSVKERPLHNPSSPLLIYDGECGFCVYSVSYWRQLTGDKVSYHPYQEVGSQYPDISVEEFKSAVQYVAPSGEVSRAAKASFLTLSHAPYLSFLLWLYQFLPGFALVSEIIYKWVAGHRELCYRICKVLWGRHYEPPRYQLVAWLLLRGIGLIYLVAFTSFTMQALGLIGSQGIVPLANFITLLQQYIGVERYWLIPMVFWFSASDLAIQVVCWSGVLLSVMLVLNILPRVSLLLLYILYLSLVYAGQVFMTFQWDLFLLEAGVIAIFLTGTTTLGIWLMRWLLFRFMFAGGLVKIVSGDPTWRDFTALQYHFFTQPLPTPLAWYANQLPTALLTMGTVATLVIELFLVFLIFFPRRLRFVAAFSILLLQFTILITGNYNFFNVQTIVLCLALFDDAAIRAIMPARAIKWISRQSTPVVVSKLFTVTAWIFAFVTITVSVVQLDMRFWSGPSTFNIALSRVVEPGRFVNVYGPFAVMTKKRYEIVIEGSNDNEHWEEYAFKYKPGDVTRRPQWNIPLQPRLDWQMWFASLGSVYNNPWFEALMYRLLEGSPAVLALFANNPFPDAPPKYIRALYYNYHFTNIEERRQSGAWWKRERLGDYFP